VPDVSATIRRLGIEFRESGDELTARCPMHEARTGRADAHPSWSINAKTGLFNCFSCGYRGSLATLVRDLNGDASDLDAARSFIVRQPIRDTVSLPDLSLPIRPSRALDDSLLGRFTAPPTWARNRRRVSREACAAYQVLWDLASESWILPIREPYSLALMGWQEKSETSRKFRNHPIGVKKSHTVFGVQSISEERVVVVESPLDAVRLWTAGITGAVAVFGALVSKRQLSLMTAAQEVIFALDNPRIDEAGKRSVQQLLQDTKGVLRSVKFFDYGKTTAKDPGDMTDQEVNDGIRHARSRAYGRDVFV
jgi:hypothetical protein